MMRWPSRRAVDPERSSKVEFAVVALLSDKSMENKQKKWGSGNGTGTEAKVDYSLDLRGMIIPLTFLKITQAFRKINTGETMEIIGTDPDTRRDFLRILATSPCEVLRIRDEADCYLIRLRKGDG